MSSHNALRNAALKIIPSTNKTAPTSIGTYGHHLLWLIHFLIKPHFGSSPDAQKSNFIIPLLVIKTQFKYV